MKALDLISDPILTKELELTDIRSVYDDLEL